jgi:hypothetical protein
MSALVIVVMTTACGNNNEGGGGSVIAVPPGNSASCEGCPTSTTLVSSATNVSIRGDAELSLNFHRDASQSYDTGTFFQGNVVADGTLHIKVARPECGIPAGLYTVRTLAPVFWYGTGFQQELKLEAIGGPVLHLSLYGGALMNSGTMVDSTGATFPFKLITEMYVSSTTAATTGMCGGLYREYRFF